MPLTSSGLVVGLLLAPSVLLLLPGPCLAVPLPLLLPLAFFLLGMAVVAVAATKR
jgi:hypothetical protein